MCTRWVEPTGLFLIIIPICANQTVDEKLILSHVCKRRCECRQKVLKRKKEKDLRMHSGWAPLQVRSLWHVRVVEPSNRWPL